MYWRGWGFDVRLVLFLPLLLAGCSQWSGGDGRHDRVVVDWHCETDAETGQEQCHKRKLVDGEPIDDVIYDSRTPERAEPQKASPGGDAVRWDKQPLTAVNSVSGSDELVVENTGPAPREPRETVDLWSENERESAVGSDDTDDHPGISAERRAVLLGVPGADISGSDAGQTPTRAAEGPGGYTVQLAAFPSADKRDAFLARRALPDEHLHTRRIRSRGQRWWIVAYGAYPAREQAVKAYRELEREHGIKGWVRSWDSIRELAID